MIQNNNLSPLPWYSDIKYQNARKSYAYGNVYPLFSQAGFILPFQFVVDYSANTVITNVLLFDKDGKQVANITDDMIAGQHIAGTLQEMLVRERRYEFQR